MIQTAWITTLKSVFALAQLASPKKTPIMIAIRVGNTRHVLVNNEADVTLTTDLKEIMK